MIVTRTLTLTSERTAGASVGLRRSLMKTYYNFILAVFSMLAAACSTSDRGPNMLMTFPGVSDVPGAVDPSSVLARAREDFEMLAKGRDPRYAQFESGLYDGGTRIFKAQGYQIIDHHRAEEDGRYTVGQTITFDESLTGGKVIEHTNARLGDARTE